MSTPPSAYSQVVAIYDHRVTSIGAFMSFLAFELKLKPSTVANYVCGVRDGFRREHKDITFFAHEVLKQLRSAIALDWRAITERTANFERRLPFTIEMLVMGRKYVTNMTKPKEHAALLASTMALTMLNRASELIMTEADHFVRAQDVTFHVVDNTSMIKRDVPAYDAHKYHAVTLTGVTTLMRSAKNDIDGVGHKASFNVMQINEDCAFCIATDMFAWAKTA